MDKLTASLQQVADDLDKKKKPVLGLNLKLSSLISDMSAEELEDLERYAEFILSKKKCLTPTTVPCSITWNTPPPGGVSAASRSQDRSL